MVVVGGEIGIGGGGTLRGLGLGSKRGIFFYCFWGRGMIFFHFCGGRGIFFLLFDYFNYHFGRGRGMR